MMTAASTLRATNDQRELRSFVGNHRRPGHLHGPNMQVCLIPYRQHTLSSAACSRYAPCTLSPVGSLHVQSWSSRVPKCATFKIATPVALGRYHQISARSFGLRTACLERAHKTPSPMRKLKPIFFHMPKRIFRNTRAG